MAKYDRTGDLQHFHFKLRRSLRHIQCLLPNDCFDSKQAAIAIHMTTQSNLICRFHKRFQKQRFFDGSKDCINKIQGVPKVPCYRDKGHVREEGYMDCGCLIDDVLMEFYFWKTLTITSPLETLIGIEEPMKGTIFWPRERAFLIQAWMAGTGLTVDDIYSSKRPRGMPRIARENWLLNLSVHRLATKWVKHTGIEMVIRYPAREAEEEKLQEDGRSGLNTANRGTNAALASEMHLMVGKPWYT